VVRKFLLYAYNKKNPFPSKNVFPPKPDSVSACNPYAAVNRVFSQRLARSRVTSPQFIAPLSEERRNWTSRPLVFSILGGFRLQAGTSSTKSWGLAAQVTPLVRVTLQETTGSDGTQNATLH